MTEIEILERRIAEDAEDATSIYQLAVLLWDELTRDPLRQDEEHWNKGLARIRTLLTRVITLDPKHARAYAQLGYTLGMLLEFEQALAVYRLARKLDPKRAVVDVAVADMLAALDRKEEFLTEVEALAKRQKVDLKAHRAEIARTGWEETPDLLLQAFIRPDNFLRSELSDEAERIRNSQVKGRRQKVAKRERDDCAQRQKQLKKEFKATRVPKELRSLAAAASKYGIGDDVCRPLIMKKVPKATRARLIKAVDKLSAKVQSWLDSFGGGDKMSVEAAAYMYLYEAIEEIRA
jgi:tetratricopeptide (TPR) repeat protein